MSTARQSTFGVTVLTERDHRILAMLRTGNTQSQISKKLSIPRSTVHLTVKGLERANLIRSKLPGRYNKIYDVVDVMPQQQSTPIRVHNISMKYRILEQSGAVSRDRRAGFVRAYKMRGGERYVFNYLGKAGEPQISIRVHPRTLIVSLNPRQYIHAPTYQEAEDKAYQYCANAIRVFAAKQRLFGVVFHIESTGRQITLSHFGGAAPASHPVVAEVAAGKVPGWAVDKSYDEMGISGIAEIETTVKSNAAQFEKAMQFPEIFPQMLDSRLVRLEALMQGGTTAEQKVTQLTGIIGLLLEKIDRLEKKMEGKG